MKICIIGLGYIGLPTAAMFSSNGCDVLGVDLNRNIVNLINNGSIHIHEPGLKEIIGESIKQGTFKAQLIPKSADVFIISVPTPNKEDEYLSCDLSYVIQACKSIVQYVQKGNIIIIESTMAPRSTEDYLKPIFEDIGLKVGKDIYLAHCPERVLPGNILFELVNNDRIIGGVTSSCTNKAAKVYEVFVKGNIIKTNAKVAEMSKCVENTFRDVNIALANELVKICNKLDVNSLDVIEIANKHPRVNILNPGPGVGGHCLAVDPYFIYSKAPEEAKLIKAARNINLNMPKFVADKIKILTKYDRTSKVVIFGVSYKGNIGDIRESPSLKVIDILKKEKYNVEVYDPYVNNQQLENLETILREASLITILTDHNSFKNINYDDLAKLMKNPLLFDTRNIINKERFTRMKILNYGDII